MGKVTKRENERRQQAVLQFFLSDPEATGDEAQRALVSGRLLGVIGPPMGIGLLHRLQRQAREMARKGVTAPAPPRPAAPSTSPDAMAALRKATEGVQKALVALPDITEVTISRSAARVSRQAIQQEQL